MKKITLFVFGLFVLLLMSFSVHKFYVSIYQINFNQKKQMLEITSRIFIDDLNATLSKKYNIKTHIAEQTETPADFEIMKKYILGNFVIKINGQPKPITFLSKEQDGNVVVCYYNIKAVSKIKTLEVQNTCLLDLNSDQQNIIQTTIYGKKQDLLLTNDHVKGMLKQE